MHRTRVERTPYQLTFVVLTVATMAYALLQSLVIPVLATIQAGLHTSQNSVTWVLTAYLLSASIFTPIMGRLGDMFGKERMLVLALVALAGGCVLAALTNSLGVMLVARVIQGVGGGVLPLSFGLIRDEFPAEKVPGAVGVIAALAAAGAGLGIVLAGPIVKALDYHWLFWIPMIILAGAAVAAFVVVPESRVRTPGKINWGAAAVLSGWLVALMLAVSEAPTWGWTSFKVIGLLVVALVLAVAWVQVELRSVEPLIDMKMMRIPTVWTTNLVALLLGVGMYAAFAFLPEYLETPHSVAGYGFSASITQAGLILLPSSVLMFVFGSVSGRLSGRFSARGVLIAGATIAIAPFLLLTVARGQKWEILIAMGLQGVGFGLAFAAMSSLVVQAVSPQQTGVASGMNANIRTIGGSFGAAVMSSIVTSGSHHGLPLNSGYTHGFLTLTIAAVGAAAAALLVPRMIAASRRNVAVPGDETPHAELALLAAGTLVGDQPE